MNIHSIFNWLGKHPFKVTEGNYVAGFANLGFWVALVVVGLFFLLRRK